MKEIKNYEELRTLLKNCHSIVSQDTGIMLQAIVYFIKVNEKTHRKKRKLSAYNMFVSKGWKEGKSMKKIAELWQKMKVEGK